MHYKYNYEYCLIWSTWEHFTIQACKFVDEHHETVEKFSLYPQNLSKINSQGVANWFYVCLDYYFKE